MKNAANCVNQCELQDTLIIDVSNAHGGPGSLPGPRPVEGRLLPKRNFAVHSASRTVSPCLSLEMRRAAVSERELLERARRRGFFPSRPWSRALGGRFSPSASRARAAVVEAPFSLVFAALVLFLDLNSDETTP